MKLCNQLLLLLVFAISTTIAQEKEESCSFKSAKEEYYKENPQARIEARQFNKKIQQKNQSKNRNSSTARQKFIIPVVFHIYGTDWAGSNPNIDLTVTDERVREALQDINDNFKGGNIGEELDPNFKDIEGKMNIEFKLAQVDPDGNTTTGIIHHESKSGFGLGGVKDTEIAEYAWDNYKYMNVHIQIVIKESSRFKSGVAWFPDVGQSNRGVARVVYNGKYIKYLPPASSLTHEFGHFLGLEHTFKGGCVAGADKGDGVADTPPTTAGEASNPSGDGCVSGVRNCFNRFINSQNHMDYNPCEAMFTKGQVDRMEGYLDHDARKTLWTEENIVATGVKNDLGKRLLFTYQDRLDSDLYKLKNLIEDVNNNGSILNKKKIKAVDGARFSIIGRLQEGTHYTTTDVPNGLNVVLTVLDNQTAEISLEGNAIAHKTINSATFKITLLDRALIGGVSSLYSNTGTYHIKFFDSFKTYYETLSPYLVMGHSFEDTNNLHESNFNSPIAKEAVRVKMKNYNGNVIIIDNSTFDYEVLCNSNTMNVKRLSEGQTIQSGSGNWITKSQNTQTSHPVLSSSEYTNWHGKSGYMGVRYHTITGGYLYGWAKVNVNADGSLAKITNLGINPKNDTSILAKIETPHIEYSTDRFIESISNNSTMGNDITATLHNASFAVQGKLQKGVHYTVENIEDLAAIEIEVLNSTTAKLSMKGVFDSETRDQIDYKGWGTYTGWQVKIEFLDAAFEDRDASQISFTEFLPQAEYIGESYKESLIGKSLEIPDGPDEIAEFRILNSTQNVNRIGVNYHLQWYDRGTDEYQGIKLLTYRKDAIANENYELTPLDYGTLIGPNSSWKNGREFFEDEGQHMIDSKSYQEWRGKTKYIGIRFRRSGGFHYGWIKLRVSNGGKFFEFKEFGVNGTPERGIYAGTITSESDEYCEANGGQGPEAVTRVRFAGINKTSERSTTGYEDHTSEIANVAKGGSYNLTVDIDGYQGGNRDEIYAWIDWNQNNNFFEPEEYVKLEKTSGEQGRTTITVPENAKSGNTRMRVRVAYISDPDVPCGEVQNGEVEDYTINIGGVSTNEPPTVTITSPSNGAIINKEEAITISATASDSDGNITIVEFFDNDIKLGEDTSAPYTFNWTSATKGDHVLTVRATDNQGEITVSSNINITIVTSDIEYCEANGESGTEAIVQVVFEDINKVSARAVSGYEDHTHVATTVNRGGNYDLTVTIEGYRGGDKDEIHAWFDWNQNGSFMDAGEYVKLNKQSGLIGHSTVTVPQNTTLGSTKMRLRVAYYDDSNVPCGSVKYGEVEDYTLNISQAKTSVAKPNNDILSVSPNPYSQGELTIGFKTQEKGMATISLFNINGVKVLERNHIKEAGRLTDINIIKELGAGIYFLKVIYRNKVLTSKLVVK